jgi:uncharacterized protein
MPVDKDDPRTWVKYKESDCRTCRGTCCTMPAEVKLEDFVRLGYVSEDECASKKLITRLKKEGVIQSYRSSTELFMLEQKSNGDCIFLDSKTRRCTVYAKRPLMCRNFPTLAGNRLGFCPKVPLTTNKTLS